MMVEKFRKLLLVFLGLTLFLTVCFIYALYEPFIYRPAWGYFGSAWDYFLVHILTPLILAALSSLFFVIVYYFVLPSFEDFIDVWQLFHGDANARATDKPDLNKVDGPKKPNKAKQETPPKVSTPANAPVAPVARKPKNASVRMRDVPSEDPPPHITEVPPPTRSPSGPPNETKQPKPKQSNVDFKKFF